MDIQQAISDPHSESRHSGMIDWLTLKIDLTFLPVEVVRHLQSRSSRIFQVNCLTGEEEWSTYAWESVRSDSHQVTFRVGSEFHIQGSPARIGQLNNVFGSLDVVYCARKMIHFAADFLKVEPFPDVEHWKCSRIDVTRNYLMQSSAEARQALEYLKQSPAGRQKHSFESDGFYIGKGTSLHKGKVYLKGQDAARNQRLRRAVYTDEQITKANRLLRAEYTIARHMIRRLKEQHGLNWYQLKPDFLLKLHSDYFSPYFSDIEVTDMTTLLDKLKQVAPSEGKAKSAYDCYSRIRMFGYDQAKQTYPESTWCRHLSFLKKAGLKRSDLQPINVIPLRKRAIILSEPVRSWDDISAAC